MRHEKRGEPDPLPPHPGGDALNTVKLIQTLPSDEARKEYLRGMPEVGWQSYVAARRYDDAVRRNRLIEHPEQIPNKLDRVRELVRLGYGTPHYETQALVDNILGSDS